MSASSSHNKESNNGIPLADDDSTEEVNDIDILKLSLGNSNKLEPLLSGSGPTSLSSLNMQQQQHGHSSLVTTATTRSSNASSGSPAQPSSLDIDALSPDEIEEKQRLIGQVLELQNTLEELSQRVDKVKDENVKLRSENQVLGQYIENLMSASSVFQQCTATTESS